MTAYEAPARNGSSLADETASDHLQGSPDSPAKSKKLTKKLSFDLFKGSPKLSIPMGSKSFDKLLSPKSPKSPKVSLNELDAPSSGITEEANVNSRVQSSANSAANGTTEDEKERKRQKKASKKEGQKKRGKALRSLKTVAVPFRAIGIGTKKAFQKVIGKKGRSRGSDASDEGSDSERSEGAEGRSDSELKLERRHVFGEMVSPATGLALGLVDLEEDRSSAQPDEGEGSEESYSTKDGSEAGGGKAEEKQAARRSAREGLTKERSRQLSQVQEATQAFDAKLADNERLLRRFAETKSYDVEATVGALREYSKWRGDVGVDALTIRDVEAEMGKRHIFRLPASTSASPFSGPTARDNAGHPIIYKCQANFERHARGADTAVDRAHAFIFESVCTEMDGYENSTGGEKFTVLLDMSMCGSRMGDLGSIKRLAKLLKVGYRGRLHCLYVFPTGRIERIMFAAVRKFVGQATARKIRMLGPDDRHMLYKEFPKSALPVHLGGTSQVLMGQPRVRSLSSESVKSTHSDRASPPSTAAGPSRLLLPEDAAPAAVEAGPPADLPSGDAAHWAEEEEGGWVHLEGRGGEEECGFGGFDLAPTDWPPKRARGTRLWNICTRLVVSGLVMDYGFLRGTRAGVAHLVLREGSQRRGLPPVIPALFHGVVGFAAGSTLVNMPSLGGVLGAGYLLGRFNATRRLTGSGDAGLQNMQMSPENVVKVTGGVVGAMRRH